MQIDITHEELGWVLDALDHELSDHGSLWDDLEALQELADRLAEQYRADDHEQK